MNSMIKKKTIISFNSQAGSQNTGRRNPLLHVIPFLVGIGFLLVLAFYFLGSFIAPMFMGKCVAVIEINTELITEGIPSSMFAEGVPGSSEIVAAIKELDARPDVGAVVFVINSGGGSIIASREIYDAINSLSKPKVAYFREVAASGAYYISTPADYIISDPYTLTGSIGVIMPQAEMSGLLENLGVNITSIASGEHKDIGSPYKQMDTEEEGILQDIVNLVFEDFKSVILKNRGDKLDKKKFEEVLDGRVLLGVQAYEIGLVDALGTKQDAINKAAELAGLPENPRVSEVKITYSEKGLFELDSFVKSILASGQNKGLQYK